MNLETWLSLYKKTGESREDAVDRYIVEQGITDPAEKESLKGQLSTSEYTSPAVPDYFSDSKYDYLDDSFKKYWGSSFQEPRQEFMPPSPQE